VSTETPGRKICDGVVLVVPWRPSESRDNSRCCGCVPSSPRRVATKPPTGD